MMSYQKGDRVVITLTGRRNWAATNRLGTGEGTVEQNTDDDGWTGVHWDRGESNAYRLEDLEFANISLENE